MPTYIALLRGINVGGHHKVAMADLRAWFEAAGHVDVTTYIQSGNVVFTGSGARDKIESDLERRLKRETGFDLAVVTRTATEWDKVVRNNPYPKAAPTSLIVSFLKKPPPRAALRTIDVAAFAPDEFTAKGREIYLHLPNGQGRAKLPQALNRVQGTATARNWQTVLKLLDLARASGA
jgi:uncharacterized protein (DUF1697 family)